MKYKLVIILFMVAFLGCKKFVEVEPPKTQITSEAIFQNDQTVNAALLSIYTKMSLSDFASGNSFSVTYLSGLSADELRSFSSFSSIEEFYRDALTPTNSSVETSLWGKAYELIYSTNLILEKLESSSGVSAITKNQVKGECKFIRGFCYFYLVNLFGEVPLVRSSDFHVSAKSERANINTVYEQIIEDLTDAEGLLQNDYSVSKGERARPNKYAAKALLARVFLYIKDWSNAEIKSSEVIGKPQLYSLVSNLNSVFLKNSTEAIWQIMPVKLGYNTNEALTFILTTNPSNSALQRDLVNSFEFNDRRRVSWIDSIIINTQDTFYFPVKYKVLASSQLTEYSMILRLAEMYLIRAEVRAQQNKLSEAQADLNIIRNRVGLPNTTATTQSALLDAILRERRVELFTEWGHRWFDLKRTDKIDQIMSTFTLKKGGIWKSYQQLYPIPQNEISKDLNLTQNPGY